MSHHDPFVSAVARNGAKFATLNRVMGLHFEHIQIDVLHMPGRTEVIKISGGHEGREESLKALTHAADMTDRVLRFASGLLDAEETRRLKIENTGWRPPQPRPLFFYADPGRWAIKPMIGKAKFNEDMGGILNMLGNAATKGDVILIHDERSQYLPKEFWEGLDEIKARSEKEGRAFREAQYGKGADNPRASVKAVNVGMAAAYCAEIIANGRDIRYIQQLDDDNSTESAYHAIARKLEALRTQPPEMSHI